MSKETPTEVLEVIELINNRPSRITLEQLAKATETSVSFISNLVNGRANNPTIGKLSAIRNYLKAV